MGSIAGLIYVRVYGVKSEGGRGRVVYSRDR